MAMRTNDRGLSEQELAEMYDSLEDWGEHPTFKMIDWRDAVVRDETRVGYWAWVASCIAVEGGTDPGAPLPYAPAFTESDTAWLSGLRIGETTA
jgi:hypothetical protein